jgi:hypothetical protein
MAFAALVSAIAWVDSSINYTLRGRSYGKAYLFPSRDKVLADPAMTGALRDALIGKPDDGSAKRRFYHNAKDVIPTFMEIANGSTGDAACGEEMPSKYLAFCGVTAGGMAGWLLGVLTVLAVTWAL